MWATLIFIATVALFIFWTISTLWHIRWVQRLASLATLKSTDLSPLAKPAVTRCSVVMAARNEEARIEQTIRRLLAQQHVELELIVVDDRSTDRTTDILKRIAAEESRLKIKRVDTLPDDWLGKCHACHIGATAAANEWILFTDADCWLNPDVIARAFLAAQAHGADHVTLTSGLANCTVGLKAFHLLFLISVSNWFSGVNRDRQRSYMGIGAFNLVRAEAYRQCGGYERLRLTILDDMRLGLLLRRAGKRTRAFMGAEDATCHWGSTVWDAIGLMEKNFFATVDYQIGLVIAGSFFTILVFGVLAFGILSRTPIGLAAAMSPFSLAIPAGILARRAEVSWVAVLCVPFIFPIFLLAVLNSTFVTLRRGGVRWRDTFYSLETLRAGNVR
jgi:hypothetical protein